MITVQAVPVLSDNYSWLLRDSASGTVAIVDPGEASPVIAAIEAGGGRLDLILLTHHHGDHIAGTDELRARFGAKVIGAAADAHRLPKLDTAVAAGDTVAVGESRARVLETPGHTRGHIAYVFDADHALFCGDTLFSLGCGRLLEGTAAEMFGSLAQFAALPSETLVYCGHEYTESNAKFALSVDPNNTALRARAEEAHQQRAKGEPTIPSRLGDEKRANPFLLAKDAAALADVRGKKDRF